MLWTTALDCTANHLINVMALVPPRLPSFFPNLIADLVPGCPGFSQSYDSPPLESGETSVRSDHVERRTAIYSGVGRHVLGLS